MKRPAFFDTNIFIYADDKSSPLKQQCAIDLFAQHLRSGSAVISLQVMQEYFSAATGKLGIDAEFAQQKVELIARSRVVRFVEADIVAAIELHRLTRISFWDAMIVHAARIAGAEILYSEGLQHSSSLGGVRIVNPFLGISECG
jgi:predicted nucleic acid-binding protein